jgi:hypothetical protein
MPGSHLFEYAVIRIVPRVEREEFVNAGVIVYCANQRFLHVAFVVNEAKILALYPKSDITAIRENLASLQHIAEGRKDAGPIAQLDMPSRFRWLTAMRSTVVQTSRVHPGLCTDGPKALEKLLAEMVL